MILTRTAVAGAYVIEPERIEDERGFFARTFCRREFEAAGLNASFVQCNISFNRHKGTLRGLHYQDPPHAEAKLIRCTMGAIFDVIVDLRRDSPTFKRWGSVELTASNRKMMFAPEGCAHGFQTLEDDSEVLYQMSGFYRPDAARGCRWDDPIFGIEWPPGPRIISDRDRAFPDFGA